MKIIISKGEAFEIVQEFQGGFMTRRISETIKGELLVEKQTLPSAFQVEAKQEKAVIKFP